MKLDDIQKTTDANVQATMNSFEGPTKVTQEIASQIADYSKRSFEQGTRTMENLLGAKSPDKAFEVQNMPGRPTKVMSATRPSWVIFTPTWPEKHSSRTRISPRG